MKHKTLFPFLLILSASHPVIADSHITRPLFSGIYFGGNIGLAAMFNKTTLIRSDKPGKTASLSSAHISKALTAQLGFAWAKQRYRIAPELFMQYAPQVLTTINTSNQIHFNQLNNQFAYGIHLKLARQVAEKSFLIGMLGIQNSQFRYAINNTSGLGAPMTASTIWQWGWTAGAGTETMLTNHMAVTLEVNYTHYHITTHHVVGIINETPATLVAAVGLNYFTNSL